MVAAAIWALPVGVFEIRRLDVVGLRRWLRVNQIGVFTPCADRRLRGCLVAACGFGAILLDSCDTATQRQFTLAHELAHFLLDYFWPRERAIKALGNKIVAVLDGLRPPTHQERMNAILKGAVLGTMTHLMERGPSLEIRSGSVLQAEDSADALAIELLAPYREIVEVASKQLTGWMKPDAERVVCGLLAKCFGLPTDPALRYARRIIAAQRGKSSFQDWLGGTPPAAEGDNT